jgi:peptidoglycan/LPS O-acetylase OafA/YrhL
MQVLEVLDSEPGRRIAALDLLRALAVMLVMFRHLGLGKQNAALVELAAALRGRGPDPGPLARVLGPLYRLGWTGVDLFFVLSGFLVSGLLFGEYRRQGALSVRRFFVRRAFKIHPAYYTFLALTILLAFATVTVSRVLGGKAIVVQALMVQNYFPPVWVWGHTWSLAVEEHSYVLLAVALMLLARRGGPDPFSSLPRWLGFVAAAALAVRAVTVYLSPGDLNAQTFPTHARLDSLGFGVLLAYYHHFRPSAFVRLRARRGPLLIFAGVCLAPAAVLDRGPFMITVGLTLLYVGYGALLVAALPRADSNGPLPRWARALVPIGTNSYSIYLWHVPVVMVGGPRLMRALALPSGLVTEAAMYIGMSLAVGIVAAKVIEWPMLRLRDRLFPSPVVPRSSHP